MLTFEDLAHFCTDIRTDHPGRKAPVRASTISREPEGIRYQVWTRNPDGSCTCTENFHRYEAEPTNGHPIRNFYVDQNGNPIQKKRKSLPQNLLTFLKRCVKEKR